MLLWDRLKVMLKASLCRETWRLSLRQRHALSKVLLATRPATAETGTFLCVYCPPVGSVAFRRHLDGIRRIASGQYVPLVVHVSVTDRCPCACAHCSNLSRSQPDPELETMSSLLEDLKRAGTVSVAFTGGEPLLRPDLPEMIRRCEPEMSTVLFTTGLGLDSSRADELRRAGRSAVFVSLDHHEPSRHNQIRRHSDAFEAAVQAIQLFRERGIYTAVQAVVSPDLLDGQNMQSFLQFCRSLAIHEVMLLEPVPVGGRTRGCSALSEEDRHHLRTLHGARREIHPCRRSTQCPSWRGRTYLAAKPAFHSCMLRPGEMSTLVTLSRCPAETYLRSALELSRSAWQPALRGPLATAWRSGLTAC